MPPAMLAATEDVPSYERLGTKQGRWPAGRLDSVERQSLEPLIWLGPIGGGLLARGGGNSLACERGEHRRLRYELGHEVVLRPREILDRRRERKTSKKRR